MSIDLLHIVVEREGATLPEGFDVWGIKSVRSDLRTYGGFQWPLPGTVAEATAVDETNLSACPARRGDGLCVATTWRGMASGGIPARTLLLVATHSGDVLGRDATAGKSRHRRVAVVALVDGERLLREAGTGADLRWADLRRAGLHGANLHGADLRGADLRGADMYRASLRRASLREADLGGADLGGADLRGSDLRRASLREADLRGADLYGADLRGAIE